LWRGTFKESKQGFVDGISAQIQAIIKFYTAVVESGTLDGTEGTYKTNYAFEYA
jgi:hypothetical protein